MLFIYCWKYVAVLLQQFGFLCQETCTKKISLVISVKIPGNIFYLDSSKLSMIFYCYINKFHFS